MIILNGNDVDFEKFPNGEIRLELSPILVRDNKFAYIHWWYEDDSDLMKLYFLKKELDSYCMSVKLEIRYMPYSRMDRTEGKYAFTLRHVCDFLNDLKFNSIIVIDPHSDVTCALLKNSIGEYPEPFKNNVVGKIKEEDAVVYYPDSSAFKKYSKIYGEFPSAIGIKTRNFSTGKIENLLVVGDVKGRNVVMVDDLCVFGNTFIKGAEELKKLGAERISLCVTHCEPNIFKGDIPDDPNIEEVLTTDTIIRESEGKVTVVKI